MTNGSEFALHIGGNAHVMLADIRKFGGDALLKAEKGACIVLSINDADDGLTLYTGEQVDAIRKQTGLMKAATAVCEAWNKDLGAEAVKQAIAALTREVQS